MFCNLLLLYYKFGNSALLKDKDNFIIFNEVNPINKNISKKTVLAIFMN